MHSLCRTQYYDCMFITRFFIEIPHLMALAEKAFEERFDAMISQTSGLTDRHIRVCKAALSNMLGGLGYYYGRELVKEDPDTDFESKYFCRRQIFVNEFSVCGILLDSKKYQILAFESIRLFSRINMEYEYY